MKLKAILAKTLAIAVAVTTILPIVSQSSSNCLH